MPSTHKHTYAHVPEATNSLLHPRNCLTSAFAGFAVFATLGGLAHQLGYYDAEKMKDVITDGKGLAFITYPETILHMPYPAIWAVLFFLMLFTLGLDSNVSPLSSAPPTQRLRALRLFSSQQWRR